MLDLISTDVASHESADTAVALPAVVMEQAAVERLLDRLCSDDAFRALFLEDTAAALLLVGAPMQAARCIRATSLASKQALSAARDALRSRVTGELAQNIHNLFGSV